MVPKNSSILQKSPCERFQAKAKIHPQRLTARKMADNSQGTQFPASIDFAIFMANVTAVNN